MQKLTLSEKDVAMLKFVLNPSHWYYENGQYSLQYFNHTDVSIFLINLVRRICNLSPTNSETHIIEGHLEILCTATHPCNFIRSGVVVLSDVKLKVDLDEVFTHKKTLKSAALNFFADNPKQLDIAKKSSTSEEVHNLLCNIF